jgi:hypothetical protein
VRITRPLRGDGAPFAGTITLRRMVSVATVNGEEVADALPELPAERASAARAALFTGRLSIPAGQAAKIWVSVDSRGALPGRYRGLISVSAATPGVGAALARIPIDVEVLPLAMPTRFPLELCTWDYVPNRWFPKRTGEVLDDMARHGVDVFPRPDCIPKARVGADGALAFDWSPLDEELARLKGRGRLLIMMSDPPISYAAAVPEARRAAIGIAYVRAVRDHLRMRGWTYGDYAFYPMDEPGLEYGKRVPVLLDAAKLIHAADPKLRVYADPVPSLSWRDFTRLAPALDIWCPNMHLVSGLLTGDPRMRRMMASGKLVWSYECVSQVKSLSPLCYDRGNPWRASYFGLKGIGFWTYATVTEDPWQANATRNDEYALVYPGELPVPSVRWEALRAGMQDVAAMAMLRSRIASMRGDARAGGLIARAEDCLRIARADVMEISDGAFVQSRDYLRKGDRRIWHTPSDEAAFGRHRALIGRLTIALDALRRGTR